SAHVTALYIGLWGGPSKCPHHWARVIIGTGPKRNRGSTGACGMAELHPAASDHLPIFVTAPGQTDVLMVVTGIIRLLSVLGFGILFLRLHSLPERMAHKAHKIQFEIVAVLCLISLFTHMHIFWIAGLLLAMVDMPDFGSSLSRIAGSAEKIA